MDEPSRDDLIYFAAVIDCEGSVSCTTGSCTPSVHVGNNYKPLCDQLSSLFGGSVTPSSTYKKTQRICWRWALNGRSILPFLRLVTPFLRIKRRQAELAVRIAEGIKPKGHGLNTPVGELQIRALLAEKINNLNKEVSSWSFVSYPPSQDSNATQL